MKGLQQLLLMASQWATRKIRLMNLYLLDVRYQCFTADMMKLYYTVLVDGGVGHAGQEVEVVGEPADAEDDDDHHQPAQDHDQPPRHPPPSITHIVTAFRFFMRFWRSWLTVLWLR